MKNESGLMPLNKRFMNTIKLWNCYKKIRTFALLKNKDISGVHHKHKTVAPSIGGKQLGMSNSIVKIEFLDKN